MMAVARRYHISMRYQISFLDSKASEFMEFQQGRLDFINDIDANFKDEVLTKKGELKKEWTTRIRMAKHPYLNTEYLGILFDTSNTLLKDSPLRLRKVRQAMNYAIDRRKMMMYLRNSIGTPAESGFIPAGLPSFDTSKVKGYHFDLAEGQAIAGRGRISRWQGHAADTPEDCSRICRTGRICGPPTGRSRH